MTDANPFKAGSRKAEIYDVFRSAKTPEEGLKAAYKEASRKGAKLIKEGTVKSWAGSWAKGTLPTPKGKAVKRERMTASAGTPNDDIWFRHDSLFKANKDLTGICERAGLRPHAFHIIENDGKFAVVPISTRNDKPIPQFEKGDVVYDCYSSTSKARIIQAGPEQSMIRYDKESTAKGMTRPRECAIPNRYLIKLPDEPITGKPKREKLPVKREKLPVKKGKSK